MWYDEKGLSAGDEWVATIQHELQARDVFFLILTPASWASEWVLRELNLAFVTHRQVVPILHQYTPEVSGFLLALQWIKVVGLSPDDAAHEVLRHLPQGAASPARPSWAAPGSAPSALGPAPAPPGAMPAHHLTPVPLYTLGFRGYAVSDGECILPPLCWVPGGVFIMGSDRFEDTEALDDEMPQCPVEVSPFALGQYPVTVAEYACCVRMRAVLGPPGGTLGLDHPYVGPRWPNQLQHLDHPVSGLSWEDATAYAHWLAQITSQPWRLPTEAEWEKAARWDAEKRVSRLYPWGNQWDKKRANTGESRPHQKTKVGAYASLGDASPCGAHDLAGNVWEWTSSISKRYPYRQDDGRENPNSTSTESRVLRGGSWYSGYVAARTAYRREMIPRHYHVGDGGLRLALGPDSS
jgi:formylglycine-generating enzyme required for sulfatase activity